MLAVQPLPAGPHWCLGVLAATATSPVSFEVRLGFPRDVSNPRSISGGGSGVGAGGELWAVGGGDGMGASAITQVGGLDLHILTLS